MEFKDDDFEFVDVAHAVVSIKSAALKFLSATPLPWLEWCGAYCGLSVSDEKLVYRYRPPQTPKLVELNL
jgi:hypothetical protein